MAHLHTVLRLKMPSLVLLPDLNPLCNLLTSLSIFLIILCSITFKSNFVIWLIKLSVLFSVQLCAFDFFGNVMNIGCFKSIGVTPLFYMMLQRLVITSMFSSSSALSISVDISSEPVAFPFFIDCIVFSTSSFQNALS